MSNWCSSSRKSQRPEAGVAPTQAGKTSVAASPPPRADAAAPLTAPPTPALGLSDLARARPPRLVPTSPRHRRKGSVSMRRCVVVTLSLRARAAVHCPPAPPAPGQRRRATSTRLASISSAERNSIGRGTTTLRSRSSPRRNSWLRITACSTTSVKFKPSGTTTWRPCARSRTISRRAARKCRKTGALKCKTKSRVSRPRSPSSRSRATLSARKSRSTGCRVASYRSARRCSSAPALRRVTLAKRGYATVERTIIVTGEDKPKLDIPLQSTSTLRTDETSCQSRRASSQIVQPPRRMAERGGSREASRRERRFSG